jgi:hypothetical protein
MDTKAKPSQTPRPAGGRPASDATGINIDQRRPIDPRMPTAPPA